MFRAQKVGNCQKCLLPLVRVLGGVGLETCGRKGASFCVKAQLKAWCCYATIWDGRGCGVGAAFGSVCAEGWWRRRGSRGRGFRSCCGGTSERACCGASCEPRGS